MNITDSLSAVSILTAILIFFYGVANKGIDKASKIKIVDKENEIERMEQRIEVRNTLWLHAIPIFLGSLALFYSCLPQTFKIVFTSNLAIWHIDLARTLFVFLEISLLFLFVLTFKNICKLVKKLNSF